MKLFVLLSQDLAIASLATVSREITNCRMMMSIDAMTIMTAAAPGFAQSSTGYTKALPNLWSFLHVTFGIFDVI